MPDPHPQREGLKLPYEHCVKDSRNLLEHNWILWKHTTHNLTMHIHFFLQHQLLATDHESQLLLLVLIISTSILEERRLYVLSWASVEQVLPRVQPVT